VASLRANPSIFVCCFDDGEGGHRQRTDHRTGDEAGEY
jgi:hypothetical protein